MTVIQVTAIQVAAAVAIDQYMYELIKGMSMYRFYTIIEVASWTISTGARECLGGDAARIPEQGNRRHDRFATHTFCVSTYLSNEVAEFVEGRSRRII